MSRKESLASRLTLYHWLVPIIGLVIAGIITYYPSLHYPFQFDDDANIKKFYQIRELNLYNQFFAGARWIGLWLNSVNFGMGGENPYYFRIFNVIIHIISSILVFLFAVLGLSNLKASSFFKKNAFLIALVTSILFLLHPTQTQTVSYVIQGRMEGVAGLLVVGMAVTFLARCYVQNGIMRWLLTGLLFALAAFSTGAKESTIISPLLIIATDWFFVAQGNWMSFKKRLWIHAIVFSIVIYWFVYYLRPKFFTDIATLQTHADNNVGNMITTERTDKIYPLHYFISEFKVILHYLWIFVWPFNISVDYDWMLVDNFFAPDCIGPFLILLIIGAFILYLLYRNKANVIAFGLIWFFISILPRASIIPTPELLADYKTYLGSVGWLLLIAAGIVFVIKKIGHFSERQFAKPSFLAVIASCLALPLSFATLERNKVWRTKEEFWGAILKVAPKRARAYNNFGVALADQNKFAEAVPYFKKAYKMDHLYSDPLNNLAVSYSHLGRMDAAIDTLRQSLEINPSYPEGYNNLGSFFIKQKRYPEAINALEGAFRVRPHYGKAYYNQGRAYKFWAQTVSDKGQQKELFEKAYDSFRKACTEADFDLNIFGWNEYAIMAMILDRKEEVSHILRHILTFKAPANEGVISIKTQAALNLGNYHFSKQEYFEAKQCYAMLLSLQPNHALGYNNLAECHFNLNEITEALECFEKAKSLEEKLQHIDLRIAACHTKTGNYQQARFILNRALNHRELPAELKQIARNALIELDRMA
ncbi:tetratricopeptide repeat protein [Candidatus Babeliales bacterium]|nr:tetratricopeptide repeat protein [Candidatus Babeliales bacterium]